MKKSKCCVCGGPTRLVCVPLGMMWSVGHYEMMCKKCEVSAKRAGVQGSLALTAAWAVKRARRFQRQRERVAYAKARQRALRNLQYPEFCY